MSCDVEVRGGEEVDLEKRIADLEANAVLSINPTDFFEIENQIGDKKVVLIFDDFERCTINTVDLFGCINSYCENQGLKVIVIADEEQIEPSEKLKSKPYHIKILKKNSSREQFITSLSTTK